MSHFVPLHAEPLARGIVERCGGPWGRHATRLPRPLPFILAVGWVFMALAYLSKANCAGGRRLDDGTVALNWEGGRQYTSFCYNDIIPLYSGRGLDQPGFVYAFSWAEDGINRYMEYPVLAGFFQGALGWVARHTAGLVRWAGVADAGWYFALTCLVLAIVWVATLRMCVELAGARPWDVLVVAASPLVIIHAFTNWDIPAIALAVAGMLAVKRGRPGWAGALFALGCAFKLWPIFLLGAYLVLAVRNRRWAPLARMFATAVITWLAVNLPVALAYPQAWGEFFRLNSTRGWEWTTIYAVIDRNLGLPASPEAVNAFSLVAFLGLCGVIALFGWRAARTPRVAELVFLILVAFLLVNKVWSPQYSLWLLVPAVLALPRWRLLFTWGLVDALLWPVLMWHMHGTDNLGLPGAALDLAIAGRDGLIIAIAVLVIRQMLGLGEDKVAAANGADILAGDFSPTPAAGLEAEAGSKYREEVEAASPERTLK